MLQVPLEIAGPVAGGLVAAVGWLARQLQAKLAEAAKRAEEYAQAVEKLKGAHALELAEWRRQSAEQSMHHADAMRTVAQERLREAKESSAEFVRLAGDTARAIERLPEVIELAMLRRET
jgi:hypothetical protein